MIAIQMETGRTCSTCDFERACPRERLKQCIAGSMWEPASYAPRAGKAKLASDLVHECIQGVPPGKTIN